MITQIHKAFKVFYNQKSPKNGLRKVRTPYYTQTNNTCVEFVCTLNHTSSSQRGMYQRKVDLDMFNDCQLADISSLSPSSEQRNSGEGL